MERVPKCVAFIHSLLFYSSHPCQHAQGLIRHNTFGLPLHILNELSEGLLDKFATLLVGNDQSIDSDAPI